tara:strand:+ start:1365 stop:1634 length:270 start_codon:yes stop_codon:yes gene_type:complete
MKKYLVAIFLSAISTNLFAAVDEKKCDSIKDKSDKIECLTKLRLDALKAPVAGQLKIIDNKIKKFDADKKKFDKENKTLWQMYKNYKKK